MTFTLACAFAASIVLGCGPPLLAQRSPDVAAVSVLLDSAVRDVRALHPGMKRADVEKNFDNASLVFPSPTRYTWRRLPTIHIDVEYNCKKDSEGRALFSPDDTILSVSKPYLDDVSMD